MTPEWDSSSIVVGLLEVVVDVTGTAGLGGETENVVAAAEADVAVVGLDRSGSVRSSWSDHMKWREFPQATSATQQLRQLRPVAGSSESGEYHWSLVERHCC